MVLQGLGVGLVLLDPASRIETSAHALSRGHRVVVVARRIGLPADAGLLRRGRMAVRLRVCPRGGRRRRMTVHQATVERAAKRSHSHHDDDQIPPSESHDMIMIAEKPWLH